MQLDLSKLLKKSDVDAYKEQVKVINKMIDDKSYDSTSKNKKNSSSK